jgi:tetratricopeptide (TPR) repeat protein
MADVFPTTSQHGVTRLQQLERMLEKSPSDTFLLYGVAMEHKKAGDLPRAIEYFDRVIRKDDGYCYAYHQRGLAFEMAGDVEAAKRSYKEGVEAARRKGDAHAEGEIQAALDMVG